jgi:glycyl-tRNA synthetase beta chain
MPKDLLIEIGMEEIPARFVRNAMEQLRSKTLDWLSEMNISSGEAMSFATPRRIAVKITGVADKQEDRHEEVRGPSKKIAVGEDGQWSKAALGFARSQGVDPEQLFFADHGGTEYVFARKSSIGVQTMEVLKSGLADLIASLHFPKSMRWGDWDLRYVRPIRWIVAMFGDEVIPLELAGVTSGRKTKGHRFLGSETELASAADYEQRLREQHVIADPVERRERIMEQIERLARANDWHIDVNEDLLEEVLFLVEYPTVLSGGFDAAFLQIPQEVLITSMREHQRYFPVFDSAGNLLPHFVTVRNGGDRSLDTVAKGNEKVLRARLSDARFFYEEDQKQPIPAALSKLNTVVFHEELGTIGDKVKRIRRIVGWMGEKLQWNEETRRLADRAAEICKFDLVTQMVYEFPELQGVMGRDYALKAGEPEAVAQAVFEHYQPRFSGDAVPASEIGAVVAIADKLDTLAGCFSIGIIPSGSQDPYGLRRQAAGIVQILLDRNYGILLSELFQIALDVYRQDRALKRPEADITASLSDFFGLRVKNTLAETVRYDIVDAVMASGIDDVCLTVAKAKVLMDQVAAGETFKPIVESFNRVIQLAAKASGRRVNPSAFHEPEEEALYSVWKSVHDRYSAHLQSGDAGAALLALGELKDAITSFFDKVMVMAEDPALRENRLALLANIADDLRRYADFSGIVWL